MPFKLKGFITIISINMKLKQIISSFQSINYLLGLKLSAVLSYKLALLAKKLNPEVELYSKTRDEKLKEYGEEVFEEKDGKKAAAGTFNIPKEKVEDFNKEISDLLEAEIKVDVPEVNISDFGGLEIEPKYLIELDWLIKV